MADNEQEQMAQMLQMLLGMGGEQGGGMGGGMGGLPQPGGLSQEMNLETNYEDVLKFLKARAAIPTPMGVGGLPGAGGFAPGGPQLAFGGGSPWPVDPNPSRIHNSMILMGRMFDSIGKIRGAKDKDNQGSK